MTTSLSPGGLGTLEAAYQTLGDLLGVFNGPGFQTDKSAIPAHAKPRGKPTPIRRIPCRNYIKYPAPQGLRPRAATGFKVADLCEAYNFPTNLAGGGVIGILELSNPGSNPNLSCGYKQSDLDLFAQINGLPDFQPDAVSVNGGQNAPGGDGDGEVLLDIEVVAAVYYYCTGQVPTIKVYFAPNDNASFPAVMKQAAGDGCDILSISWGADESGWGQDAADQTEAAAQQATGNGCVIFAASGDNSSSDGDAGANVDLPAACPHVIGCGGTKKTGHNEVVWGNGKPDGRGTGGGYSALFPPPDWQTDAPSPPPPSPGRQGRMVPDVAADADPNTGYLVVIDGQQTQIGGTSAVAPLYAGLFASFGRKLGFVTPKLWQNPPPCPPVRSWISPKVQTVRSTPRKAPTHVPVLACRMARRWPPCSPRRPAGNAQPGNCRDALKDHD